MCGYYSQHSLSTYGFRASPDAWFNINYITANCAKTQSLAEGAQEQNKSNLISLKHQHFSFSTGFHIAAEHARSIERH
jgi:hypothetical protein